MNNNSNEKKYSTVVKDRYNLDWGCTTWTGHGEKEGEVTYTAWAIAPRVFTSSASTVFSFSSSSRE